jgi:trigger factor
MSNDLLNPEKFTFAEDPTFDVNYKGDCAYEVGVVIPVANEVQQTQEMLKDIREDAEIPGFRRGKAPKQLLKKKFSKAIKKEVGGKLVSEAFQKLVTEQDLKPVGYPDITGLENDADRPDDQAMTFTFTFEVSPRVELGKYRGLKVERPVVTVDEEDILNAIDEMLKQNASYQETDDQAEEHDQVIMDFKGTVDGEEFSGGAADNYPYIVGSKRFFPEFEEVLLGAKAGDERTCQVEFPEDYQSPDVAGKTADFTITINEVKRQTVPNLTDEFAEEAGFKDTDDLREKVTEKLRESSEVQSNRIAESRALEQIIEASTYEMSTSMIQSVAMNFKQQEFQRLGQSKMDPEAMKGAMEAIEANADEEAVKSIKAMVTLNEIGETEGVEVTDDDFEKEAVTMAKSMGMEDQVQMVAQYMAQGDQRSTYADRIYRAKAIAIVLENATITDKELSRDELDEIEKNESEIAAE